MRRASAGLVLALLLAGCSNSVSEGPRRGSICEQEVRSKVFGITYSTDRNHINCGPTR